MRPSTRSHTTYQSIAAVLLILGAAMLFPAGALAKSTKFDGLVMRVHDGDTLSVVRRGRAEKVKLAGIDCPELRQSFGSSARNFTSRLTSGQTVTVRIQGTDEQGRILGVVILPDGRSLNRELVAAGLAWKLKDSKNKQVAQLEKDARRAKRGLWADAHPTPPWDFRKTKSAKR
ncbi:MAG TPA: thermonuclease family protein [Nitrospiria bacterium]|nr:thermonuclease family protein [Nitrospiria bacterium]